MNNYQKHRSQLVLASIFVIFTVSLAIAGVLYYRGYEQRFRQQVELQLNAVADLKAGELVQWRRERLGDAAIVQNSPLFGSLAQRYFDNPQDADASSLLRGWISSIHSAYQYDEALLLDAVGALRLAVPEPSAPIPPGYLPVYLSAMQTAQTSFLDFHRDAEGQPIHLSLLIPIIKDQANHQAIGLLVLRINPNTYLYPLISRWPAPSETAETLLVRREGDEVVFLNELRFQENTALNLRFPLSMEKLPAALAASGRTGIVDGVDYRGMQVVADLRPIPDSPWFMVARMDAAEVYAPLRTRLWELLATLAVLLAGAGAGVGMLWRQQSARYYQQQYEHARERAWLQDIIARSMNEVFVFDPQSLRFLYANTGACRNIGYSLDELASLTPLDLKPYFTPQAFEELLQPLRAGEQDMLVFETIHRRKDGTEYPVEVHLQMVEGSRGNVFLAIINDIAERKAAENSIRKLNRIYAVLSDINQAIVRIRQPQALFETACAIAVEKGQYPMAWIGLLDGDGQELHMSAYAGQAGDFFAPQDAERSEPFCPLEDELRAGKHTIHNLNQADPSLSPCQRLAFSLGYRSSAAFPLLVSGEVRGALTLYEDQPDYFDAQEVALLDELTMDISFAIEFSEREEARHRAETELRVLNTQLEQRVTERTAELQARNRELETFTYSVSHDLKAPLRGIDGYSRLLLEDYANQLDEEGRTFLHTIRRATLQMSELIDGLLAYSRLERRPLQSTLVNLGALVESLLSERQGEIDGRNVEISLRLPDSPLRADPDGLTLALRNLLDNALKFTSHKDRPQIEIEGRQTPTSWVISVSDNGAGFDMKFHDRIFDIFQRLHRAEDYPGTGVGLAIVRKALERMGGRAWAESAPGNGATFFLEIPK